MKRQTAAEWARQRGYQIAIAGPAVLTAIKRKLARLRAEGKFAPGFFEENLSSFRYLEGSAIESPKAILIVAVPSPAQVLVFKTERGLLETVLPPTYVEYRPLFEKIRVDILKNVLGGKGQIETLQAPLKTLAAAAGLVCYGRNNVTYVPELGSYFQLAGYVLDVPLAGIPIKKQRPQMLAFCSICRACVRACPQGVISKDRFLVRADRCYTLFSESSKPLPEGLEPPSPDCLIGCLKCQLVCPANKGCLKRIRAAVSFTRKETSALLAEGEIEDRRLSESIRAKFKTLALTEGVPVLRRNLRRLASLS